ncbi:MAG: hypothetical protein ABEJ79_07610 [Halolamina sp.]
MATTDPFDRTGEYDRPDDRGVARRVGVSTRGEPIYYDPVGYVRFPNDRDAPEHAPDRARNGGVDLGDARERLAEAVGADDLADAVRRRLGIADG